MNKQELIETAQARSDQINSDDLINTHVDVTIKAVQRGPTKEQALQIALEETEKFYRPSKTFRRALIGCFGDEPSKWIGQRIRLIRNPDTTFGGVKVGGIEVSHASIKAPIVLMLSTKRGKKSAVSIDVMPPVPQVQKPAPMPAKVKEAAVAIQTPPRAKEDTISGDPDEGDLTGIGSGVIPQATIDAVIAAFAAIGLDQSQLEKEYGKPINEWTTDDIPEVREVLKAIKRNKASSEI